MNTPWRLADLVPGLTVGELARPGRRLRWLTAGTGGPTILLVSGAGETALDWLPTLQSAATLSTVVAVDRAGLGLSDPAGRVSVESQVDDLVALLTHLGPSILVGHSWGGLLVQLVAWRQPRSVVGLVLVDPAHEEISASIPLRSRFAVAAMGPALAGLNRLGLFARLARPMGRSLAARCTTDLDLRAAVEQAYLRSYGRPHQVAMIGKENRLSQRSIASVRSTRASAPPIDVPLVVLIATTGKPRALLDQTTRLLTALAAGAPHGRHVLVDGASHYIHHDRPDAVAEAITSVLDATRPSVDR